MKKREKALIILCVLAIICVVGIAVCRKSGNSDTQEKSGISDAISDVQEKSSNSEVPEESGNSDAKEKDNNSEVPEESGDSDAKEKGNNSEVPEKNRDSDVQKNYEDSSEIAQLILVGEFDIDMYSQDELKYYYHPNSEDYKKDGPHIRFDNAGKLGDQDIVITYFDKERYTIKLSSNKNQISQIGILNEQKLQALSDFSLKEGDVVEILYSPEKSELRYNNKKINFDEERSLLPEDKDGVYGN